MLRIYFSSEDIARTRIAVEPDPLWELVLGLQMLRPQRGDLLFTGWRQEAREAVRGARLSRGSMSLVLGLTPTVGYFPDFLNPMAAAHGLEYGLEAIRGTAIPSLERDVRRLAAARKLPDSAWRLAAGEVNVLVKLTDAMQVCFERLVTPYRRAIQTAVGRDRRIRTSAFAHGGVEGMLNSLRPMMTWSAGELCVPGHRDQELRLRGRGLLLIPSYFCVTGPLTMLDPELPPVLIYPVERRADALPYKGAANLAALEALVGTTRAAVLEVVGAREGTITTEMARRVGISAASASEHATVLREAGLISSHRDRNRVMHQLTELGLTLLEKAGSSRDVGSSGH
jgi:DNA-binding transcriptional ArsR family regulator